MSELTRIVGIGRGSLQRLNEAGIFTLNELVQGDVAMMAAATKMAQGTVQGWVRQARQQMEQVHE